MRIHPTAIVSKEAVLADDVEVGAFAYIEGKVTLGKGCVVHSRATLLGPLTMGERNVVHSTATLGDLPQDRKYKGEHSEVIVGDDNIFREGVTVHRGTGLNTKTLIGNRCYFMVNAHVGHNCIVGDGVTLINGALLGGFVTVDSRAIIGGNCGIHQFCRVGTLAMVTNACCMTIDMPPFFTTMSTNTVTQLNSVGLRRSGMTREEINAVRKAFQFAFRDAGTRPLQSALADLPDDIKAAAPVKALIEFCHNTKRGVARYESWSGRHKAGVHENSYE